MSGRARLPPPGFHNSSASHLPPSTISGYSQGGYGSGTPLNLPSSAVDSLFGPPRRSGPAPGFSQAGGQQDLLFGLGGSKAGLGDLGRLGISDNRLGMGLFDQKPNHPPHHIQDSAGFSNKDWQVI